MSLQINIHFHQRLGCWQTIIATLSTPRLEQLLLPLVHKEVAIQHCKLLGEGCHLCPCLRQLLLDPNPPLCLLSVAQVLYNN